MQNFTDGQLIARMQIRLAIVKATIAGHVSSQSGLTWYLRAGGNEAPFRAYVLPKVREG